MPPKKKAPAKSGTEQQSVDEKQPVQEQKPSTQPSTIKAETAEKKPENIKEQPKQESIK